MGTKPVYIYTSGDPWLYSHGGAGGGRFRAGLGGRRAITGGPRATNLIVLVRLVLQNLNTVTGVNTDICWLMQTFSNARSQNQYRHSLVKADIVRARRSYQQHVSLNVWCALGVPFKCSPAHPPPTPIKGIHKRGAAAGGHRPPFVRAADGRPPFMGGGVQRSI